MDENNKKSFIFPVFMAILIILFFIFLSIRIRERLKQQQSTDIKIFDNLVKTCEKYEGGTIITSPNDINCWTKFGTYQWDKETNEFISKEILK